MQNVPNIPKIDLAAAIRIYYSYPEIGNAEIRGIFEGKVGDFVLQRLKKTALALQVQEDVPQWNGKKINTSIAFRAWGLDIEKLERNYQRLKKLGLAENI